MEEISPLSIKNYLINSLLVIKYTFNLRKHFWETLPSELLDNITFFSDSDFFYVLDNWLRILVTFFKLVWISFEIFTNFNLILITFKWLCQVIGFHCVFLSSIIVISDFIYSSKSSMTQLLYYSVMPNRFFSSI